MAAPGPVFQATFSVINQATGPLRAIREEFGLVGAAAEHAGKKSAAASAHAHHSMGRFHAGLHLSRELTKEFGVSIGETSSKLSELMPALAGLGAIGGIAGMFEFTAHMAEARAETLRMLKVTQLAPKTFGMLSYAAAMTDTPMESVTKGAIKLGKVLGDAASGKNASAAALFKHLGISLRDANGHVIDVNAALPKLMEGFRKNTDTVMRTRMAFALFGKGGAEMLPILTATREELGEWDEQAKRIRYPFTKEDNENLEAFNQSWKRGTMAVGAFNNELSAKLAPVLRPIVDQLTDWVTVNRDWLATDIAGGVKAFADEAKHLIDEAKKLDWHAYAEDVRGVVTTANSAAEAFGGWHNVIEGLVALVVGRFALSFLAPLAPIAKLGIGITRMAAGLVLSWGEVEAAAGTAAAAEALAAGGGKAGIGAALKDFAVGGAAGVATVGAVGGAAYGLNSLWNYADPTDHMDRWLDRNVPGYSGADNFFSHVGMGTPYAQQGLGTPMRPRIQRTTAAQQALEVEQMQRLEDKGWSHANAAGIMASLVNESGLDPNAEGDNHNAHGIAQWHGDRQRAIELHFKKRLADMSVDDQVDAVDWEMRHGTEQEAGRQIMAQRTAFGSGAATSRFYERPLAVESEMHDRGMMANGLMLLPPAAATPSLATGTTPVPALYGPRATAQDAPDGAPGPDGHVHVRVDVNNLGQGQRAEIASAGGSVLPVLNVGHGVGSSEMLPERF
ncbi:MAG: phage tail tip lysozyme [Janthinobacterium lividum]